MDPVPKPANVAVFGGGKAAKAAADAASAAKREALVAKDCEPKSRAPECFSGELGNAIDEADERRIQLLVRAREVSNGNATFNTLQYPFGAAAVYEKLRGAANRTLLPYAALAGSLYGIANSGVVDRERHYLREAFELHCAIVRAGPMLYLEAEVNGKDESASTSASLTKLISNLQTAIENFRTARTKISFKLQGRTGSGGLPTDPRERRVAQAAGRGGATAGNDKTDELRESWAQQAAIAKALYTRLNELKGEIGESGDKFRREVIDITGQAQSMLSERVPLPRNPKDTIADLKALPAKLVAAQSGEVPDQAMDPVPAKRLLDGLSPTAREHVENFAGDQGDALQKAYDDAHSWALKHDGRVQASAKETAELKCQTRLAPVPVRAAAPAPAANKPSTDNTAGSANTSGTPLPEATR